MLYSNKASATFRHLRPKEKRYNETEQNNFFSFPSS